MGWFDEQIRQRKLSDQEILEDSMFRMASVVLGRQRATRAEQRGGENGGGGSHSHSIVPGGLEVTS